MRNNIQAQELPREALELTDASTNSTRKDVRASNMKRPIRIYLDTSDYGRLANKHSADEERVFEFLLSRVESGEIEIAHSFFIFGELIREFDGRGLESRLERARILMRLTHGLAFKFPPVPIESPLSNDGRYLPIDSLDEVFSPSSLRNKIRTELAQRLRDAGVPRSKRKAMLSKTGLRTQIERLSDEEARHFVKHRSPANQMAFVEQNIFKDLYLGRTTQKEAEDKFYRMLSDTELMVKLMYASDAQMSIKDVVEGTFIKIDKLIDKIRRILGEMEALRTKASNDYKEVRRSFPKDKALKDIARKQRDFAEKSFKEIVDKLLTPFDLPPSVFPAEVLHAYLSANMKSDRVRERSTIIDMWHAVYLPHCDLWRGDSRFSRLLLEKNVSGCSKIVSNFLDLPSRIDRLKKGE